MLRHALIAGLMFSATPIKVVEPLGQACAMQPQYLLFFEFGEASPTASGANRPRSTQLLDAIATGWKASPGPLSIIGHTDEVESRKLPRLDLARAEAIRDELVRNGVDPAKIAVRGDAFENPTVPRPGPEIQNRYATLLAPDTGAGCTQTQGIVR